MFELVLGKAENGRSEKKAEVDQTKQNLPDSPQEYQNIAKMKLRDENN